DNLHPRLRYAYGTLGGFLAGQANSNFRDSDADSETLDFGGHAGSPGVVRIPQVRYTIAVPWWNSALSFSAETPETDIMTPLGLVANDSGVSSAAVSPGINSCTVTGAPGATCTVGAQLNVNPAKATAPDLTAAWFIPQPWGHLDFALVVRPGLDVQDGRFLSRQFVGYGGQFSGAVKPGWFGWARDTIQWHLTAGDAIGRYLNNNTNFALATNFRAATTSPANAATILVKPTRELGAQIGYTHHWSPRLRSTISFGYNRHDIPFAVVGASEARAANKELYSSHVNLIWSPVGFVDVGAEYVYGHRVVLNNASGNENVLIGKFAVRFSGGGRARTPCRARAPPRARRGPRRTTPESPAAPGCARNRRPRPGRARPRRCGTGCTPARTSRRPCRGRRRTGTARPRRPSTRARSPGYGRYRPAPPTTRGTPACAGADSSAAPSAARQSRHASRRRRRGNAPAPPAPPAAERPRGGSRSGIRRSPACPR